MSAHPPSCLLSGFYMLKTQIPFNPIQAICLLYFEAISNFNATTCNIYKDNLPENICSKLSESLLHKTNPDPTLAILISGFVQTFIFLVGVSGLYYTIYKLRKFNCN